MKDKTKRTEQVDELVADLRQRDRQDSDKVDYEQPKTGKELPSRELPRWAYGALTAVSLLMLTMAIVLTVQPDGDSVSSQSATNSTGPSAVVTPQPLSLPEQDNFAPPPLPTPLPTPPIEMDSPLPDN